MEKIVGVVPKTVFYLLSGALGRGFCELRKTKLSRLCKFALNDVFKFFQVAAEQPDTFGQFFSRHRIFIQ
jgi:hypothetical protein